VRGRGGEGGLKAMEAGGRFGGKGEEEDCRRALGAGGGLWRLSEVVMGIVERTETRNQVSVGVGKGGRR
jgi:hypothetical protein